MKKPTKKAKNKEKNTTEAQIGLFETISPLLHSAFDEVKEFSKKKQDEPLNVKKVKMINRLMV